MPNVRGFTDERYRGATYNRCNVEGCTEYQTWGVRVPLAEQQRHHVKHERARAKATERSRADALRKARKMQALQRRESGGA